MSVIATVGGLLVLWMHRPLDRLWTTAPRPEAKALFDAFVAGLVRVAGEITQATHNGSLSRYLAVFVVTSVALGTLAWSGGGLTPPTRDLMPVPPVIAIGWVLMIAGAVGVVLLHRQRFISLIVISIIGLMVSATFVYLSAPDLALTQVAVETVTILLLLLALHFLPKETPSESGALLRLRDGVVAVAAGLGVAVVAYGFMLRDIPTIAEYHVANSYTGGGGRNVVNVILVDFRGYDTYGEIIVLGIAGLTIFAVMNALLSGPAARRLRQTDYSDDRSRDRHPLMMVVATRVLMPIAVLVGIYIFLRGHNSPGGGFVAGLVISIALLMQYMASGFAWTQARKRIEYHAMIGAGVVIAGLTGAGAWLFGLPFLTSGYTYVHLPPIEEFELATAALFDLGVFLTVLGAVMLMLFSLSTIARFAGETVNVDPMDFDPSEKAGTPGKDG
jgi:multicomponent K+:H+ antiporter subunit A